MRVGGGLRRLGALDFGGGTIVHVLAGFSAFAFSSAIGPRRGYCAATFEPHSIPYTVLGAGLLWVGWFGCNGGSALAWRTGTYKVDLLTRYQVNIVRCDHNVEKTVETICQAASTGEVGDGIIFLYPVEDVIRIRTRERGHEALMHPDDIGVRRSSSKPAPG